MVDAFSPCGAWRFSVRRLGGVPGREIGILAKVESAGTVTLFAGGLAAQPGIGAWRMAGAGRVVLVAEWFVRPLTARTGAQLSLRAAAEISSDGRSCKARIQWRYVDTAGRARGPAVNAEADGTRLEP